MDASEVSGGCFVHFSGIQVPVDGRSMQVSMCVSPSSGPGFLQDGCPYRAMAVWPEE
jgi:hypothetical protein